MIARLAILADTDGEELSSAGQAGRAQIADPRQ